MLDKGGGISLLGHPRAAVIQYTEPPKRRFSNVYVVIRRGVATLTKTGDCGFRDRTGNRTPFGREQMPNTSLPKYHSNHELDDETVAAFDRALQITPRLFCNQGSDRRDYGVDIQLEALDNDTMTNLRVLVQLKGTDADAKASGGVTRSIDRTNLDYVAQNPFGLYVCYHRPTKRLLHRLCRGHPPSRAAIGKAK